MDRGGEEVADSAVEPLPLRLRLDRRAMRDLDLAALVGQIDPDACGAGRIDATISRSAIAYDASRLLGYGPEVRVESPPELIAAMREQARAILERYDDDSS